MNCTCPHQDPNEEGHNDDCPAQRKKLLALISTLQVKLKEEDEDGRGARNILADELVKIDGSHSSGLVACATRAVELLKSPQMRIVSAAIWREGLIFSVPAPARHHTVMKTMFDQGIVVKGEAEVDNQGFLTSTGHFLDRREAARVATAARQIIFKTSPEYLLFSEDVW